MFPEYATLQIQVLNVLMDIPNTRKKAVRISVGHQRFKAPLPHSDSFHFSLTFHANLFYMLQVDCYELYTNALMMRQKKFVGRCQVRVRLLKELMYGTFYVGWWELRGKGECFLPLDELGVLPGDPRRTDSIGAIQMRVIWANSLGPAPSLSGPVMSVEGVEKVVNAELIVNGSLTGSVDSKGASEDNGSLSAKIAEDAANNPITKDTEQDDEDRKVYLGDGEIEEAVSHLKQQIKPHLGTGALLVRKMAAAVMTGDDYKALIAVQALLTAFNQGVEVGSASMTRSFIILQKYFNSQGKYDYSAHEIMPKSKFTIARSLFKFVIAAFGWMGVNFSGKGKGLLDGMRSEADSKTICEFLKLNQKDLITSNFTSQGAFCPVHFVAYDRELSAVIISVRGTLHANDALTDLVCDYVEWKQSGGFVHSGILAAARWVYAECVVDALEQAKKRSAKNLYICGHSLGGGCAVLLTMLMLDAGVAVGLNVHCSAFAPPPVLSESLLGVYKENIDIFVNEDDGVPRLCYGSAVDLQSLMVYTAKISTDSWVFSSVPESTTHFVTMCREAIRLRSQSIKLYHPGRVYHIQATPKGDKTFVYSVPNNHFKELNVTEHTFSDHLPDRYGTALNNAYVTYLMQELEMRKIGSQLAGLDLHFPSNDYEESTDTSTKGSRSNSLE